MAGRQAQILTPAMVTAVLRHIDFHHRNPTRDRAMVLLSAKAGLRAAEIAGLTWPMVLDPRLRLAAAIALEDRIAKNRGGRVIPLHPALRGELLRLWRSGPDLAGPVIVSERGQALTAGAVSNWFASLYRAVGLSGCSSHSGRRTFITTAARQLHRTGSSLRDVQQLAGHQSIETTQRYIATDATAQRRLVALL